MAASTLLPALAKACTKAKLGWCGCQSGRSPKLDIAEESHESER